MRSKRDLLIPMAATSEHHAEGMLVQIQTALNFNKAQSDKHTSSLLMAQARRHPIEVPIGDQMHSRPKEDITMQGTTEGTHTDPMGEADPLNLDFLDQIDKDM